MSAAAPGPERELVAAVRAQLRRWFGEAARVDAWELLRVFDVPHAQPAQRVVGSDGGGAGAGTAAAAAAAAAPWLGTRVAQGVYCCGDHVDCPSLNGAVRSGRLAAEAVLDDLHDAAASVP